MEGRSCVVNTKTPKIILEHDGNYGPNIYGTYSPFSFILSFSWSGVQFSYFGLLWSVFALVPLRTLVVLGDFNAPTGTERGMRYVWVPMALVPGTPMILSF